MAGSMITSVGAILLGLFLILAMKYMKDVLVMVGFGGYSIAFYAAGFVLVSIGLIFFIYSLMLKLVYHNEKPKQENKEVEIYVCPFCGDKLTSKEALDQHIEKFHKEEKNLIEKPKDISEPNSIYFDED